MRHRLEPSIESRIRISIGEVVNKELRDCSRRPGSGFGIGSKEGIPNTAGGAPSMYDQPNEQGSYGIDEWLSTSERGGISMKARPSFLGNEHTRSVSLKRRLLLPPRASRNRELRTRSRQARQCQALPPPNRRKASRHSSQTSRRRKWSRGMILGFKNDLARKRMARPWQTQLANIPRVVARDKESQRRRVGYGSIQSFDWNASQLTESVRDPSVSLHEQPSILPIASVTDGPFAGSSRRQFSEGGNPVAASQLNAVRAMYGSVRSRVGTRNSAKQKGN